MKFSDKTLKLIKNFASINEGIVLKPGNKVVTVSKVKTILASATITDSIAWEMPIYDLNKFLGVVSLHDAGSLDIDKVNKDLISTSNRGKTNYRLADPAVIKTPPGELKMPPAVASFKLEKDTFRDVLDAASSLGLPNVTFVVASATGKVSFVASDITNDSADIHTVDSANKAEATQDIHVIFKVENLDKLMNDRDYTVNLTDKIVQFESPDLSYYVAVETKK